MLTSLIASARTPFQRIGILLIICSTLLFSLCVYEFSAAYIEPEACALGMDDSQQWEVVSPPDSTGSTAAKFELHCSIFDDAARIWDRFIHKKVSTLVAGLFLSGLLLYFSIPYGLYRWILKGQWREVKTTRPIARAEALSPSVDAKVTKTTLRDNDEADAKDHHSFHASASDGNIELEQIKCMIPTWIMVVKTIFLVLFTLISVAGFSEALRILDLGREPLVLAIFVLVYGKMLSTVFNASFAVGVSFSVRFINSAKKFIPCVLMGNFLPLVLGLVVHPIKTFGNLSFDTYRITVLAVSLPLSVLLFSLFFCGIAQFLYFLHGCFSKPFNKMATAPVTKEQKP